MEKFKVDFTSKTLTITKAFADKAENPDSQEYKTLKKIIMDFPDFEVVRRTHKTPSKYKTKSGEEYNCNPNRNLKYKKMEVFIDSLKDGESKKEVKKAYNFLRYEAGGVQTSTYNTVRKWFVEQFPHYRKDPLFYISNEVEPIDTKPFVDELKEKETKLKEAS